MLGKYFANAVYSSHLQYSGIFCNVGRRLYSTLLSTNNDLCAQLSLRANSNAELSDLLEYIRSQDSIRSSAAAQCCKQLRDMHPRLLPDLADLAAQNSSNFTTEQLTNVAVSFAKLGHFNIQFKDAVSAVLLERLGHYSNGTLANALWSYGQLEYFDYNLMNKVSEYVAENAPQFDSASLAKILWSMARVGFSYERLTDVVGHVLEAEDIHDKGSDVDIGALVDLVEAKAKLGLQNMKSLGALADYAIRSLDKFTPNMLARFTYSLAEAGYRDDDVFKGIGEHVMVHINTYNPEDISRLMVVFGELGIHDVPFLDSVCADVLSRLDEFERRDLTAIVTSFNKVGYYTKQLQIVSDKIEQLGPTLKC
eukprot:TRINITY_DN5893_c0_g1_i3.p1 TRINITY_DN5893_c0_g1~~TRINITY_DN5893_c0_g1_i3.p1  ORF type:complete len:391 (-),score=63.02 TRINITY_DN5893_c0_g1_i3:1414-2511(-)